ncbi:MAG: hypothetical protein JWM02_3507 [Frankiales bacterium]|nr:hypothetical protein [Frankiales bacterium]
MESAPPPALNWAPPPAWHEATPETKVAGHWIARHKAITAVGAAVGVVFVIGLIGSATDGSTSAASSPKASPAPPSAESLIREAIKNELHVDKLVTLTVTPVADGVNVHAVVDSHEALQGKNAPKAIREAAEYAIFGIYRASGVTVNDAVVDVRYSMTDPYGKSSQDVVLTEELPGTDGARLDTSSSDAFFAINWDVLVNVTYEHPALRG